jgi:hypothetical protein
MSWYGHEFENILPAGVDDTRFIEVT